MKKGIYISLVPLLSLALIVAAIALSITNSAAQSKLAPTGTWTIPASVSNSPLYDNVSSIGVSPLNGAATIGWEQRNEPTNTRNYVKQASNTSLGLPFNIQQTLATTDYLQSGNIKVRHDTTGRRHMIWWQQSGTNITNYYATIEPNGYYSTVEVVPGSSGGFYKGTALAVGPDNTVYALFGRDNQNINLFVRSPAGQWTVVNEPIPVAGTQPTHLALGVTLQNVVIAAWAGISPGGYYDVYTAVRTSPGAWTVENVSFVCCSGCPGNSRTYYPNLERDSANGMRLSWADEQCDPRTDPRTTDIYYREWVPGTGWANKPLVRLTADIGEAYFNTITVDTSNTAHVVYADDTGSGYHNYQIFYVSGQGTTFTAPQVPFRNWAGASFQKEPSLDAIPGSVHLTFNSNRNDPNKDVFYSYQDVTSPPATPTATPPPPRCPGEQFTDVCPGDYFYQSTLNLVNDNIISGYNTVPPCDGQNHIPCFKPFNNITRGQTAKVIALAANLPSNLQGAPHFTDVPPSHTFYQWIEFSYNAGVIGGYPCGGVGEPCDPQNRAYFRPGNALTRGQISKMTAQAFGFNEPVSGQTFQDVPTNHSFYQFIERMSRRGIIGGYTCGGPNEPCVPPNNRPYFRPGANVLRGQTTKIVDGARQQP